MNRKLTELSHKEQQLYFLLENKNLNLFSISDLRKLKLSFSKNYLYLFKISFPIRFVKYRGLPGQYIVYPLKFSLIFILATIKKGKYKICVNYFPWTK